MQQVIFLQVYDIQLWFTLEFDILLKLEILSLGTTWCITACLLATIGPKCKNIWVLFTGSTISADLTWHWIFCCTTSFMIEEAVNFFACRSTEHAQLVQLTNNRQKNWIISAKYINNKNTSVSLSVCQGYLKWQSFLRFTFLVSSWLVADEKCV